MRTHTVTSAFSAVLLLTFSGSPALADTHYVNVNNGVPAAPYTSSSDAATNIQDAVDAANHGDKVLVNDGTYSNGGGAEHSSDTAGR